MGEGDKRCLIRADGRWGVRKRLPKGYAQREHKKLVGSLEEARKYRDWIEQRILYRLPLHDGQGEEPALVELLEAVAGMWPKRDPRRSYLDTWKSWAGEMRPSEVTRVMIQQAIDTLAETKSGNTVKLMVSILSATFTYAVEQDVMDAAKNPFRKKFRMPALNKRRRAFSREEVRTIMAALGQYSPMMEFTLLTGFRASEMLGLTWEFVDLVNRYIQLSDTKGGREHVIPISDRLMVILAAQKELGSLYVFPRNTEAGWVAWDYESFYVFWREIFDALNLKDCVWHTGRHTAATWAVASGSSLYTVQGLLNHSSFSQTERYAHHVDTPKREAMDAIAEYLYAE